MDKANRELVKEDLEFIDEYIHTLLSKHPELATSDAVTFKKIERRMKDISERIGA